MNYEDKRYWLQEARREISYLWDDEIDPSQLDDYEDMMRAIDEALDDLFRLEQLEH